MSGDCWLWMGRVDSTGYGRLGRRWAHRLVYELLVGAIPDGMQLDHLCRVRTCVNPAHLEPVTPRENFLRGVHPNAVAARSGVCQRDHELTPANVYVRSNGRRMCKPCNDLRNARRFQKAAS